MALSRPLHEIGLGSASDPSAVSVKSMAMRTRMPTVCRLSTMSLNSSSVSPEAARLGSGAKKDMARFAVRAYGCRTTSVLMPSIKKCWAASAMPRNVPGCLTPSTS